MTSLFAHVCCSRVFRSVVSLHAQRSGHRLLATSQRPPLKVHPVSTLIRQKQLTQSIVSAKSAGQALIAFEEGMAAGVPFDMIHASATFNRLVHFIREFPDQTSALLGYQTLLAQTDIALKEGELTGQDVATALWSVAALYDKCPELCDLIPSIHRQVVRTAPSMNALDVSNCIQAVALLRKRSNVLRELLPQLLSLVQLVAAGMSPQGIGNIAWAISVLELEETSFDAALSCLQSRSAQIHTQFSQELGHFAHLCWCLALYRRRDETLLRRMSHHVAERSNALPDRLAGLELGMIALSYDMLDVWDPAMMRAIAQRLTPIVTRLQPWSVCALTSSFSALYSLPADRFQGCWVESQTGQERAVIRGSTLLWRVGRRSHLSMVGSCTCQIVLDGVTHKGELKANGGELLWDDGELWTREEAPLAAFLQLLHKEVRRRGLQRKVEYAREVGPHQFRSKTA